MKTNKRKLKCLLVEDEDVERISNYIINHDRLEYVGAFTKPNDVFQAVSKGDIDILFLDNELGKGVDTLRNSGFELLEGLKILYQKPLPHIISISQYPDIDTQKALDLDVWDVIAKPFGEQTFNDRIESAIEYIDLKDEFAKLENESREREQHCSPQGKIEIKLKGTSQKTHYEDLSNIVYIESDAHDIKIHLNDPQNTFVETTNTNFATLSEFLEGKINKKNILKEEQLRFFSKIHKSYIVNICYISDVEANAKINLKNIEKPLPFGSAELRNETLNKWRAIYQK
jgi:DNA-binding LytR/AlgR family response regulator